MVKEQTTIHTSLAQRIRLRLTQEDWEAHRSARECHICDKSLGKDSTRDCCHITGAYRGAAFNTCNLKLRLCPKTMTIPVVFHNLRVYDSHLLMQAISKMDGRISYIPNNTEKLPRTASLHRQRNVPVRFP